MSTNSFDTSWHVSVAAESITAYLFARVGYDVSVQYGANQPEYDLMIAKGDTVMKVSVKGSKDGGWALTAKYKNSEVSYYDAIDLWLAKHSKKTVFSLVQFINTDIYEIPRVYLATPNEIANLMKTARNGLGDTVLRENKTWTGNMYVPDVIPKDWLFSESRIIQLTNSVK
ncbi:hypothetical protein SAMN04487970_106134 [Paenibacillus tianmuensis]|uniref:PD(D/E)XK endonuclease domain-containing protein n=1 Tax=Paenibacillus tianmuensis TaxID=624147 RepID=A0A1G4TQG3_9BACL|nr:hypothetical protein [Paenibacillus tianmuensis]SCW83497.1 hypothetical protein SAMN04487970_106134 [Paenibacillus tianmuensis]